MKNDDPGRATLYEVWAMLATWDAVSSVNPDDLPYGDDEVDENEEDDKDEKNLLPYIRRCSFLH